VKMQMNTLTSKRTTASGFQGLGSSMRTGLINSPSGAFCLGCHRLALALKRGDDRMPGQDRALDPRRKFVDARKNRQFAHVSFQLPRHDHLVSNDADALEMQQPEPRKLMSLMTSPSIARKSLSWSPHRGLCPWAEQVGAAIS
jgi:hypothetical protein